MFNTSIPHDLVLGRIVPLQKSSKTLGFMFRHEVILVHFLWNVFGLRPWCMSIIVVYLIFIVFIDVHRAEIGITGGHGGEADSDWTCGVACHCAGPGPAVGWFRYTQRELYCFLDGTRNHLDIYFIDGIFSLFAFSYNFYFGICNNCTQFLIDCTH